MFQPDRRRFVTCASTSGAPFGAHRCFAAEGLMTKKDAHGEPLIRQLELVSSAPLADVKTFYHKSLELDIVEETADRLTLLAGRTRLVFLKPRPGDEKPFY